MLSRIVQRVTVSVCVILVLGVLTWLASLVRLEF